MNPQFLFRGSRPLILTLLSLTSLIVAAAIGCNEQGDDQDVHESNLRLVAVLYSQYTAAHEGKAPRDADDFRAYVESLGPGVLQRAGVSGLDELLVSRRDGEPFVVKFKSGHWPLDGAIAYERVGAAGTRFIAADLGGVTEIEEAEFLSRFKGPK